MLLRVLSVSLGSGVVFSEAVIVPKAGYEGNIATNRQSGNPIFGASLFPATVVPITGWNGTPPSAGDTWAVTGAFAGVAAGDGTPRDCVLQCGVVLA